MNPYESPQPIEEDNKYKEPLVDWRMFWFVILVTTLPFIVMISLQCLLEYVRYANVP